MSLFRVKAYCGSEVRRFSIPAPSVDEATFASLQTQLQQLFPSADVSVLRYNDDEGDLVDLSSDGELREALHLVSDMSPPVLRVVIGAQASPAAAAGPSDAASVAAASDYPAVIPDAASSVIAAGSRKADKQERKAAKQERKAERKAEKKEAKAEKREAKAAKKEARHAAKVEKRIQKASTRFVRGDGDAGDGASVVSAGSTEEHVHYHFHGSRRDKRAGLVASVVEDVSDTFVCSPGGSITKQWTVRNGGSQPWANCTVDYVGGKGRWSGSHRPIGRGSTPLAAKVVAPGETTVVTVEVHAPEMEGIYVGFWKLCDATGRRFGPRLWAQVSVEDPSAPAATAPVPVYTAAPYDAAAAATTTTSAEPANVPSADGEFVVVSDIADLKKAIVAEYEVEDDDQGDTDKPADKPDDKE